jgi:hypothetical protein
MITMATITGIVRVGHGTLVATTVDKMDFVNYYSRLRVVNRGSGDIFVSTDGATDPTVAGAEFDVVPANTSVIVGVKVEPAAGTCEIRLISSGTPAYSVVGGG